MGFLLCEAPPSWYAAGAEIPPGCDAESLSRARMEIDRHRLPDEAYREQVFTALLRDYQHRILRYCVLRLGAACGEEVAQEVFRIAWESLPKFRQEAALETWLTGIAKYQCTQALRKRKRRQLIADTFVEEIRQYAHAEHADLPEHTMLERGKLDRLAQCLKKIRDDERIVLNLRYTKDLPIPEIAELVGKSEMAVRKQLLRSLHRLRDMFDDIAG